MFQLTVKSEADKRNDPVVWRSQVLLQGGWGCGDKEGKGKEGAAEYSQAKCNTWGGAIRTLNTSQWSALIWQDKRSPDKHFEQVVAAQQCLRAKLEDYAKLQHDLLSSPLSTLIILTCQSKGSNTCVKPHYVGWCIIQEQQKFNS